MISYCEIYSFHPSLNLDTIMIFRSHQQTPEQIFDLSHFKNEHTAFFNKITYYQLKDAASAVLAREKSISLAELFSAELTFTVDTLKDWFSRIIKPTFLEIDSAEKQKFRKDNPLDENLLCCLCDFPVAADSEKGWFDFVIRWEYLFLRNIYLYEDLKQISIQNEENYEDIIRRLIEYYPLFENAIQEGDMCDKVMNFLLEDLHNCYSTLEELREEIDHISIPKKRFNSKKALFSEKLIVFLYLSMLKFCKTSKVRGIP